MAKIKSRLKETDFSRFNLRDAYITSYPEYASALRDEALFSNFGIKAIIKVPKIENNVDEYSNFVDDDFEITTESVVPRFEQYRQNVSVEGMAADGTEGLYPLEVIIPTKLHLPKNSRIVLTDYNSNEYIIAREWTVLSTEMKQLSGSKTYTRIAYCVPSRQTIHRTAEFEELYGIFYFCIHDIKDKLVSKDLRAQTTFFFNISSVSLRRGIIAGEEIQESLVGHEEEIQEVINNDHVEPEWQENFTSEGGDFTKFKSLHVKSPATATFVIKATAISVLY